jgi:hypothetical protein
MNIWVNGKVTSIPVQDIRKLTFSGLTSASANGNVQAVVKNFALFQNYPNPFNPTTRIDYEIPSSGDVDIKIFNINGELIKVFTRSNQPSGRYSVNWDGRNSNNQPVASGIYLYRVSFGNSVLTRKMLLIK